MRKNRKITPYIVLILLYIILILPIIYLTILLVGKADTVLVFCFGSVNTIFLLRYYKGNVFLSFLLGFFVSSFTLCFIYVLWFLGLSSKSLLPTIFFIIASVILCIVLAENHLKITNTRNIHFFILLPTIVFLVGSINLKESYPTKFENKNLTYAQIKIVDKQKNQGLEILLKLEFGGNLYLVKEEVTKYIKQQRMKMELQKFSFQRPTIII